MRNYYAAMLRVAALAPALLAAPAALATPITSDWVEGHSSRARLIASGGLAGVELELPEGWKTYWRFPGEAGGVAPAFDWSKSTNLEQADVLYPAPMRFTDRSGDTIGYENAVTFPVRVQPKDPAKPIDLHLSLDYGVCKDICIPVQAQMQLTLPADDDGEMGDDLMNAMARVPSPPQARRELDPELKRAIVELSGAKPRVLLEAAFPGGAGRTDVFVEAPGGAYIPQPNKISDDGKGGVTFEIDLSRDVDLAQLKGQPLTATIVSDKGQSEATFSLQ